DEGTTRGEGDYTYKAQIVDKAGNVGNVDTQDVTIDLSGPQDNTIDITGITEDTGLVADDYYTNDRTLVVSGVLGVALLAGESVQVQLDNGNWYTATIDGTGTGWSFDFSSTTLDEGDHVFNAKIVNAAGNDGATTSKTVTVDLTADTAVAEITSIADDTGMVTDDFVTNDTTLTVYGTLDKALGEGSYIEIWGAREGQTPVKIGVATVDGTGTGWSFDNSGNPHEDGEYTYTYEARVFDQGGNSGSVDSKNVQIDSVGPERLNLDTTFEVLTDTYHGLDLDPEDPVSGINNDLITRDYSITIAGELSSSLQAGEYFQISTDGENWETLLQDSGKAWSWKPVDQDYNVDTTTTYYLRLVDAAGNEATGTVFKTDNGYEVTVDLTAPDPILVAPGGVPEVTSTTEEFTFDSNTYGKVEANCYVALYNDVANDGSYQLGVDRAIHYVQADASGNWSMTTKLPAGSNNLTFAVWDEAGNRSQFGPSTSVGVSEGTGSELDTLTWGGTVNPGLGLNSAAVTINEDGLWSFFQSSAALSGTTTANAGWVFAAKNQDDYGATYLEQPRDVTSAAYERFVNAALFADYNRDGYADVISQVSSYGNASRTAMWTNNGDGTYTPGSINQGTLNHLGGAIAYDKEGDGYLDFVLADSEADSLSFLKNVDDGSGGRKITYESNAGYYNGVPAGVDNYTSILHEVSAVDLDNDGSVDIAAHTDRLGGGNPGRVLTVFHNEFNDSSSQQFTMQDYTNVFRNDGYVDYGNLSYSMTWGDYDGDGYLDLFLSRGNIKGGVGNSDESRIYFNDGSGGLKTATEDVTWMGDILAGGTSFAVDWNHDGLMDIVELPNSRAVQFGPTLYLNQGDGTWERMTMTETLGSTITGGVALDYNWDGAMDLVLYQPSSTSLQSGADPNTAPSKLVNNTNIAADGTSLQLRILDAEGMNVYYSNTVKLYDSAGNCVATTLMNPQGSGSSNAMGLVSFYGLDADETYSVQLLRTTNGETDHVGSVASQGGFTNSTVNSSWGGLTTGKSHDAYILVGESDSSTASSTNEIGIVGSGYNDTFVSSAGDDIFNGSGGWSQLVISDSVWEADGGLDTVDYSKVTGGGVQANLATGVVTGAAGNDTLINIERLLGTSADDTFTDNAANNVFEGRGGNDTYILTGGGRDTLLYEVLADGDATGGNGSDRINDFTVGLVKDVADADVINISDLLNYGGTVGTYQDSSGTYHLDRASEGVNDFVKVTTSGGNTEIAIDRDGAGNYTTLVTLENTETDLLSLLTNQQLIVESSADSGASGAAASQQEDAEGSTGSTGGDDLTASDSSTTAPIADPSGNTTDGSGVVDPADAVTTRVEDDLVTQLNSPTVI
ncbi:Ig-like domain-containing protein, partial [Desulforhopalus singaporensis]